jgi:KaiC/GvpD/RAD55 family RecA-like ATPase
MKNLLKTGILGLDDLLGGGLPEGNSIVVSGPPGVGKSNIAMQYIHTGLSQYDESGLYLNIEESVEDVIEYASRFGWDYNKYIEQKKLAVLDRSIFERADMELGMDIELLNELIREMNVKRFVLDSTTVFDHLFADPRPKRRHMINFLELMKKNKCTTLLIAEEYEAFPKKFTPEHFLSDGLIVLFWSTYRANTERCVWVVKVRGNRIVSDIRPLRITDKGVVIDAKEVPFTLLKGGGEGTG